MVPLVLRGIAALGLKFSPLLYLLAAATLFLSARTWLRIGSGLFLLVLLQLAASGVATLLLAVNVLEPRDWLLVTAATALMAGYVAWSFNLLASFLPR